MNRQQTMNFLELQLQNRNRARFYFIAFVVLEFSMWMILMAPAMVTGILSPGFDRLDAATLTFIALVLLATFVAVAQAQSIRGDELAKKVGGVRLRRPVKSLDLKKCLNVLEEMAIAAGIRCPALYIMPKENGLNLFTVGTINGLRVVVISRGLIKALERDELQAVIAHEMSHVVNGDLHHNIFMATLAGSAYNMVQGAKHDLRGWFFLLPLWLSYRIMRICQTVYCHQREYLADAMAVQMTRNPEALARALTKINRPGASVILSPQAELVNFLFIAEHRQTPFNFSVHPSLRSRIRLICPRGFPGLTKTAWKISSKAGRPNADSTPPSSPAYLDFKGVARRFEALSPEIRAAARDSEQVLYLAAAVFMDREMKAALVQKALLTKTDGLETAGRVYNFHKGLSAIPDQNLRLTVLDLSAPALKCLGPADQARLKKMADLMNQGR